jgi:hypothetical protein
VSSIDFIREMSSRPQLRDATWLLIGKGPSFDRIDSLDTRQFVTIGVNHVCDRFPVDYAHIMDVDVIERLGDRLAAQARFVVLPKFLHRSYRLPGLKGTFHRAGQVQLEDYFEALPVLKQLNESGRLFVYDSSTGSRSLHGEHVVSAGPFSAATVVELLAVAGVKRIRTIGVDGGTRYASAFAELDGLTRLDAGQDSFDAQFASIARSISKHDLDFGPVGVQVPVRVFVGAQVEQGLATEVLKHSIRKHSSISVEVVPLHSAIRTYIADYDDVIRGLGQGTPFSLQRFAIPELCRYSGMAIYLDSDMLVFNDIRELWESPTAEYDAVAAEAPADSDRAPQLSVMLINCERAKWNIREIAGRLRNATVDYSSQFVGDAPGMNIGRTLSCRWNSLERFTAGQTSLLHYTDMNLQPWLSIRNPLVRLWCSMLLDAIRDGHISKAQVHEHIARGWIRPSLAEQVDRNIEDPYVISLHRLLSEERTFLPPHRQLRFSTLKQIAGYGNAESGRWQMRLRHGIALLRFLADRGGITSAVRRAASFAQKIRRALRAGHSQA